MNNVCIVCGSDYKESRLKGLIQCVRCNFITADLSLTEDQLKQLYNIDYFHGKEYGDYLSDKAIIQKNFNSRLSILLKFIEDSKNKKLFEVGCAYGFFLEVAQKYFSVVSGIDISEDVIQKAKKMINMDVQAIDFLKYNFNSKYDVFCMWDTIEHLQEPHLFIQKVSENITQGGLLAVTTGDIGSFNAKLRGANWRQIHPPTHLQYFSKDTLKLLLEKHGFEVIHTSHPGNYLSLNTILYIIFVIKYNMPAVYKMLKKSGLLNLKLYINFFDYVYMIGRKI